MNAIGVCPIKNDYTGTSRFIDEKTNEMPTGPIVLNRIALKIVLLFLILNTQTGTMDYIIQKSRHYVAPAKGNQKITMKSTKKLTTVMKKENIFLQIICLLRFNEFTPKNVKKVLHKKLFCDTMIYVGPSFMRKNVQCFTSFYCPKSVVR